jgi:hypothetical protein
VSDEEPSKLLLLLVSGRGPSGSGLLPSMWCKMVLRSLCNVLRPNYGTATANKHCQWLPGRDVSLSHMIMQCLYNVIQVRKASGQEQGVPLSVPAPALAEAPHCTVCTAAPLQCSHSAVQVAAHTITPAA